MNYRQQLGYVTNIEGLHICGYLGEVVLYQDNRNGKVNKQRGTKLHKSSNGTYFNFKGKRVYVERV